MIEPGTHSPLSDHRDIRLQQKQINGSVSLQLIQDLATTCNNKSSNLNNVLAT